MSEFINTIDVIGESELCDQIITRTITELFDDKLTTLKEGCFQRCNLLEKVNLPSVSMVSRNAFYNIYLVYADFASVTLIQQSAFWNNGIKTLVLRNTQTVCILEHTSALQMTPIASGTGYIYVPRALLSDEDSTKDYRRATNWSTYANQFRALEDYTVDGTVTGELDESKI